MKRGVITFVFDDGYDHIYSHIVPMLDSFGFKGVFAVPLDSTAVERTEHLSTRPWQDWKTIEQKGHELAAHSVSHADLTTCSPDALEKELGEPAQTLGASTLIYPGGAYNATVVEQAKRYYSAARTVKKGFNSLAPQVPFELKTWNTSRRNFSVAKANVFALWACLTNSWLIETYHVVSDDAPKSTIHAVSQKDFMQHLKFLSHLPIANKTIRDVING